MFAVATDLGTMLEKELARGILSLPGRAIAREARASSPASLEERANSTRNTILKDIPARNARFFETDLKKRDAWADHQIAGSEKALKDIKKRIRELRNETNKASDLTEQFRLQGDINGLERRQRGGRQEIFETEDRIVA